MKTFSRPLVHQFLKPPRTGEGIIDNEVTYDVYLLEDIQDVNNPPSNFMIASNLTISESNMIRSKASGEVIDTDMI